MDLPLSQDQPGPRSRRNIGKLVIAGLLLATLIGVWASTDGLTLAALAEREAQLRQFQTEHPWAVLGIAFSAYALITGLSLPGAVPLTLLYGWYFSYWEAVVVVSFASTTGATGAFATSRYLLRDAFQRKFGGRLQTFERNLERDGPAYLFMLRLIPAVPFFVLNLVMGLTPIKARTFWWVSQLGMLPGTMVYVYAGWNVPELKMLAERGIDGILTPGLLTAFVLLGLFPVLARFVTRRWRRPSSSEEA